MGKITTLFLLIKQNASFLLINSPSDFKYAFGLEGFGPFYLLFAWASFGDFVVCDCSVIHLLIQSGIGGKTLDASVT